MTLIRKRSYFGYLCCAVLIGIAIGRLMTMPTAAASHAPDGDLEGLLQRIATLERKLANVEVVDGEIYGLAGPHLIIEGCNLHVRSGSGETNAAVNGLGNLIVGYNEPMEDDVRSGSHNLVIGPYHTYANYGGLVAGIDNVVSGEYSSVIGGQRNSAEQYGSTVTGGQSSRAIGHLSSIGGGEGNIANGTLSFMAGGFHNETSGLMSVVIGGTSNHAAGFVANITGGGGNFATGFLSSITGGHHNRATNSAATVTGGVENEATGDASTVSGGFQRTTIGTLDWAAGALLEDY